MMRRLILALMKVSSLRNDWKRIDRINNECTQKTNKVLSEKEYHELVLKFKRSLKNLGDSDLIYYLELVGLPKESTAEEVADLTMKGI